ncbi:hypothetical protein [Thalassoroseus pseudoceratinae]|uniref:hypothetical protein n=1 Tax=Thalassoroseus pseudoceratinae TaxID=2713176 RepID=UPI0019826586|nr:hypothetical protein [Thalassoroseus pseudoceratinae]
MNLTVSYNAPSGVHSAAGKRILYFSPNQFREPVAFDAPLREPLRFREAISALHDVVINDLRYKPRDKSAYEEWKRQQQESARKLRRGAMEQARSELAVRAGEPIPPKLKWAFTDARKVYWKARQAYSNYLWRRDRELWRLLMPCDPIVTVADDVVFFECFSADESSYGCLTVNRDDAFGHSDSFQVGTTNVDYSWDLYHHFQSLRSYRETRFTVDPSGLDVQTEAAAGHREEKIDLPDGWLRGFCQLQAAMSLPMRKVTLSRDAVYSLLAYLKRHKADRSPRAVRFELVDGQPPSIVLEPWELKITSHGTMYHGPSSESKPIEPIRIWGRRRLLSLARVLPLAERFDVYLLGSGFPSFWVADMGSMRLTLGLSGWTTNDWTRGSALDVLAPPVEIKGSTLSSVADHLQSVRMGTLTEIANAQQISVPQCAAALNKLASTGEVIFDLHAGVYRWRRIMPNALSQADLGPENEELVESWNIVARGVVSIKTDTLQGDGLHLLTGKAATKPVELLVEGDGTMKRGKCFCGHHQKAGLRMGPCRHLLALRAVWMRGGKHQSTTDRVAALQTWFDRFQAWAN